MSQVLDPATVAPTPWLNGRGQTRELASRVAQTGEVLWRVSVADLDQSCEFSRFPAMDRLFLPVGPVGLEVGGRLHRLVGGEELRFAGEEPVSVELAVPTRALNVMTRRGAFTAVVTWRENGRHEDGRHEDGRGELLSVQLGDRIADVRLSART